MTPFSSLRLLLLFTLVSGALSYPASSQTGQVWLDHYGIPASEWFFDHDGDSFTADQEYMAGTDPLDPDSSLSLELLPDETTPDEWIVQWQSTLGARYELLGSTGLNDFGSVPPLAGPMAGDGQLAELAIDLTGQDRYFFSLRALQPDDTDDDDLSAIEEALLGTDPGDNDTDGDTLLDGEEVLHYHTDPLVFNDLGGTIRGTLFRDPNVDGDLSDGEPQANVRVYLDSNFNGQLDSGERTETTNASGDYEFLVVPQGLHHVRQELVAPNIQTFPVEGYAVTNNLLPDEVVEYLHSAPGVGNLEEPYGQLALDVPSRWADIDAGPGVQAVPLEILLKPIGVRDVGDHAGRIAYGSEYLSLPTGAAVTVRFDEAIVDGVGPDFIINPYTPGVSTERADVFVGRTIDSLTYIGDYAEGGQYTYIDLAEFDIPGPIHFVKIVGKDLGGSTFGFDLAGLTVINFAEPDPSAHAVIVTANEVFENRDFGRYYRDLPPSLVLGFTAANSAPETPLTGESLEIRVNAFDDLEVSAVSLVANGNALALGPDGLANMIAPNPGMLYLLATATDSGGQTVESSLQIPVRRADGSYPFDTTVVGNGQSVPNAPLVRIVSPLVGEVLSGDTTVMADIVGDPPATQWTIEYASVALIDPYALDLADPDYILLNSGSGNRYSDAVGTLPVASLADGVYFIRICARNSPTRVAYFGQVFAKGVDPLTLRPTITITSPSPGDSVMVVKDIEGMIESPAYPLRDWVVDYASTVEVNQADLGARGPNWKRLASGTASVPLNAVLATFDATMVKNDSYIVRIVARNEIGLGYAAGLQLEVMGETKLGRNRLEFPDVDLNLAGFPLKFTRIYDSFDSEKNGELGYGWSIQLQDPDIRETVPETGVLGIFGATPLKTGSRIYITAPTGERLGFTFEPERKPVPTKFGYSYNPVFVPDPGNYHQLLPSEARPPLLSIDADGKATIFFIGFPYNPSKYTLVDPEGRRYHYHEKSGLLGAEDLNGNRLSFSENGIEHSSGGGLRFGRDGQGRIISLTDPENNVRLYSYDAAGDLVILPLDSGIGTGPSLAVVALGSRTSA